MAKIEDRKVVVHNDLITNVVSKMDIVPLKIFELIVSSVDTENPPRDCKLFLSKKEVYSFFEAEDSNRSTRFKDHFINLHKQTIFEETIENGKKKRRIMSPFRVTEWFDEEDQDVISILVEENFLPYLIDLKNNFTQYMISDIGNFKRKHSITLYRWLMMKWNQYNRYGNFELKNPSIKVKELRILTDTTKTYKKWQHFETEVIKRSLEEINEFSHIKVTYELTKTGRSYTDIQFYIEIKEKKVGITQEYHDFKYQSYEQRYEEHLNERVRKLEKLPLALADTYVSYLIRQEILQLQDTDNLIEAYDILRPLYQKMFEAKQTSAFEPYSTFEKHIKYVQDHMVDSSVKHRNIIEYLKVAAEDYLSKLENFEEKRGSNL